MGEISKMENGNLVWDLRWRKSFFLHELLMVDDLLSMIHRCILSLKKEISGSGIIEEMVFSRLPCLSFFFGFLTPHLPYGSVELFKCGGLLLEASIRQASL